MSNAVRILLLLGLVCAFAGCGSPVKKTGTKAKEAIAGFFQKGEKGIAAQEEQPGTPPPVTQRGATWAFGAIAGVGGILVIAGMLSLVASAIPQIPIRLNPHATWMMITTGAGALFLSFAIPRWSILFEGHFAQYAVFYATGGAALGTWIASLYFTRKLTWESAYRIGYKDGEDQTPQEKADKKHAD